jgi:DNA polymerase-3 subunit epsilon
MREIVLDTETTGLDPATGDRLVEIGCVELYNFVPTGKTFHQYLNPERDVPAESVAVHGLTAAFLADKPTMSEIVDGFLEFVGDTPLVIHNAEFDLKFINAELKKLGYPVLKNAVTDTVLIARQKFPGQPANLDALCRRYKVDLSDRTLHGALLDSQLLAEVYLELKGGRQQGLSLLDPAVSKQGLDGAVTEDSKICRIPRLFQVSDDEQAAHVAMVESLGVDAIWARYVD